jgi:hypothetical protein
MFQSFKKSFKLVQLGPWSIVGWFLCMVEGKGEVPCFLYIYSNAPISEKTNIIYIFIFTMNHLGSFMGKQLTI